MIPQLRLSQPAEPFTPHCGHAMTPPHVLVTVPEHVIRGHDDDGEPVTITVPETTLCGRCAAAEYGVKITAPVPDGEPAKPLW